MPITRTRPLALVLAAGVLATATLGCSDDDGSGSGSGSDGAGDDGSTTTTAAPLPEGPAADLSVELTGGAGVNVASSAPPDELLEEAGYEQHEYAAEGTATSYAADGELGADGRWSVQPDVEADYRTRIVVRRPADPDDASGTVVVEWLNVSGGLDADPEWQMLREEVLRSGDIWVGVSAQVLGIEGGPVRVSTPQSEEAGAGRGLVNLDPERYGTLEHPGDDFGYDIYTQVARALRAGGEPLGGVTPELVIGAGESQSAFALTTYINAVQPLSGAFDGFFVHSRGRPALPLATGGEPSDIASALAAPPTLLREDTDVPIMNLQAETDVVGVFASADVRQDDTDVFRLWEIAGTAHADTRLVGAGSDELGCGPINDGPMHLVAKAAYRSLVEWVRTGEAPPIAPRLELDPAAEAPTIVRDELGIAVGGIRSPLVDAPVDVLTGAPGPSAEVVCILSGQTTPIPPEVLAGLYADAEDYESQYSAATDEVVEAGFVLEADREALLEKAQPDRIP